MKIKAKKSINSRFRRKFFIFVSLMGIILSTHSFGENKDENNDQIVIRGGWLIDAISQDRLKNKGIMIKGGMIVSVDTDITNASLSNSRLIELTDMQTVLPGMIDMHAHYNFDLVD